MRRVEHEMLALAAQMRAGDGNEHVKSSSQNTDIDSGNLREPIHDAVWGIRKVGNRCADATDHFRGVACEGRSTVGWRDEDEASEICDRPDGQRRTRHDRTHAVRDDVYSGFLTE